jgi:hypothetical protein
MGKMKTDKRIRAFILYFDKKTNRMSRMTEAIIRGACGTQSWKIPYRMPQKETITFSSIGGIIDWPL